MKRSSLAQLLVLALVLALAPRAGADDGGPAAPVERLLALLVAQLDQDPPLSFAERVQRLEPLVRSTHDLSAIGASLADGWQALAPPARAELEGRLARWCAASYAAGLEDLAQARFAPLESRTQPDGSARVTTSLAPAPQSEGVPLSLAAELSAGPGGWRVSEVLVDGAGQVALLRERLADLRGRGTEVLGSRLEAEVTRLGEGPTETIARLQDALVEAMRRADELGYEGRHALLAPVLADTHDLDTLARLVAKGFWERTNAEQHERFTRTFRELIAATYAGRFDGFSGERFERLAERELQGGVLVESRLVEPAGAPIAFDYLLRRAGGRWRILNITVDGVSDLAIRRAEYEALFDEQGFDGLLRRLEEQIRRHRSGGE